QTVTISDTTAGAVIYYTTNGTTPNTASTRYTAPVKVNSTATLKAIAVLTAAASAKAISTSATVVTSSVATAAFTINITPTAAAPTFSPAAGTYTSAQTVTIKDSTPGAVIYYAINGATPVIYTGPLTVNSTESMQAIVSATGYLSSAVVTSAYTIHLPTTTISLPSGISSSSNVMTNGNAKLTGSAVSLTSGVAAQAGSVWYKTPMNITAFTTDFTFQQVNAVGDGMTFAIQNAAQNVNALGGNGASLGYGGIAKSVAVKFDIYSNAGEGTDSTGLYLNGAVPTTPFVDLSSTGITLRSGHVMAAHFVYDGTTLTMTLTDKTTLKTYTTSWVVNIPSVVGGTNAYVGFTGATGGSVSTQNVLTWTYTSN
ncbi:chitobiase/beta-hexosaminidase C-terminal domain-containing protein, partial [Acidicapsa ligni]|uniref:chitobiase/beta-hexosaminidase C-terminal domain-containing protein n=1 Tax=Acidicapsa ligni TaxID=542300 RepID=UPI0021DF606C